MIKTHAPRPTWGDLTIGNPGVTWWNPSTGDIVVLPPGATRAPLCRNHDPDCRKAGTHLDRKCRRCRELYVHLNILRSTPR